MSRQKRLFAWIDLEQTELLLSVADMLGLNVVAVGSDDTATAAQAAGRLDAEVADDLRHAIEEFSVDVDLLWLLTADALEPAVYSGLRRCSAPVLTSEPRPESTAAVLKDAALGELFAFAPSFVLSEGAFAARTQLTEFGAVRAVTIDLSAPCNCGSLRARLFDAVQIVHWLCGEAVEISASSGESESGQQWLTANIVCEMSRSATVTVHRHSDLWMRRVLVHGDGGSLEITDMNCRWIDAQGEQSDQRNRQTTSAEQIAMQIRRMESGRGETQRSGQSARALALVDAALLSCRTRQVETTGRMLQALAGP